MIMDRLFEKVAERGVVCLGLDTKIDYIPKSFQTQYQTVAETLFQFNKRIIDATVDVVACYKVQIAYYEAYGLEGLKAYRDTLQYIRSKGELVIGDIKRGDIADTATQYAKAHFSGDFEADFVTLNVYMGLDTLEPYLPYFKSKEKGAFILVRTSNPGSKHYQHLSAHEGECLYETIGHDINDLGAEYVGEYGYSPMGAVVGCTNTEEISKIRSLMDKTFFLIPGFGFQGGSAERLAGLFQNGNGGVVNSSRKILLHYQDYDDGEERFDFYARMEAIKMNEEIQKVLVKG